MSPDQRKLQQAHDFFRSGRPDRAEEICAGILNKTPRHPSASHLLGVLCLQRGDLDSARRLLRTATELDPDNLQARVDLGVAEWSANEFGRAGELFKQAVQRGIPGAAPLGWCGIALTSQGRHTEAEEYFRRAAEAEPRNPNWKINLGNAQRQQGHLEAAIACYRSALETAPDHPDALERLGDALQVADRLDEAQDCYRAVLVRQPGHIGAHYRLGTALVTLDRLTEAVASFEAALALVPDHVDAHAELGIALQGLGRFDAAEQHLRRAVDLDADDPDTRFNLGSALWSQGKTEAAIACFRQLLSSWPGHVKTLNNLGNALIDTHDFEAAVDCFRRMIAADPDNALGYYNLGLTLRALRRHDEAIAIYEQVLAFKPDYVEAWNDLGVTWLDQGKVEQSLACFRKALAIKPDYADAELSLGFALLYRGSFEEGWRHFEARFDTLPPKAIRQSYSSPCATRATLGSIKKLAVWAEQGLGDQMLYSSLIPELIASGVDFVFEVDHRLLAAYRRSFPGHDFVPQEAASAALLAAADANIPVGSLPALFRNRQEDFSRQPAKFLISDPQQRAGYRRRLDAAGSGLKAAISWKSTHGQQRALVQFTKSTSLSRFAPLAAIPGIQLVDVQYGDTDQERRDFAEHTGATVCRIDGVDYFKDVDEALAIIDACDLVITTSNVTAHFAGALGKPTWLLYPGGGKAPFFYWTPGPDGRSLWYPSVEVVTAPHLTDWALLIEHVAKKLLSVHSKDMSGTHVEQ